MSLLIVAVLFFGPDSIGASGQPSSTSAEGRVLVLSARTIRVWRYVTVALASFLVGRYRKINNGRLRAAQVEGLAEEVATLRAQLSELAGRKSTL